MLKSLNKPLSPSRSLADRPKERYLFIFVVAFVTTCLIFLPFVIQDNGLFLFYGDYNVQQIPFYKLAHEAVRSGNIWWNWNTDLGANFIGSYSFYLLGSPFFWLTIPFPNSWVPYLMAPLFALKFSIAAVTGYAFIRRFVKNPDYAVIGGLLYAFSGFNVYNIFFNHFNDVVAFFPLLLIALEEFVVNNRKGVFALTVGLMAVINYFFFAGQVVFLFIYFFVRCLSDDFTINLKKFLWLAFESLLGVALAAFLLLPSYLAIAGNPRTDQFLLGWNFLLYGNVQRYPLIFESFFLPPDIPARPNFFPDSNAKWSSVSAFLPLFSMAGVIAFFKDHKKHWIKYLLIVCCVMAFVPGLNSMFYMFNRAYYARWFYMPILIMALATVYSLENRRSSMKQGILITALFMALFAVIGIMPNYDSNGDVVFGELAPYPERLWGYILIGLACVFGTAFLLRFLWKHKLFPKIAALGVCVITLAYSIMFIATGKQHSYTYAQVVDQGLYGSEKIDLPQEEGEWYRIDIYDGMDNYAMYWGLPSIQAFHSVVPASVTSFYTSIGVERGVASRPEIKYVGLRGLTSVKYLFYDKDVDNKPTLPGFEYYDEQNGFVILENKYFVPMGYTYTKYVDKEQFDDFPKDSRDRLLLNSLYLTDEQIEKYGDLLTQSSDYELPYSNNYDYLSDCQNRAAEACYSFVTDNKGFTAKINLSRDNLVVFSVPYDEGWTATVDGQPVEIEEVNNGFMAVKVDAGSDKEIRFEYTTPGLFMGLAISGGAVIILIAYLVLMWYLSKRDPENYALRSGHHRIFVDKLDRIAAGDAYVGNILSRSDRLLLKGKRQAQQAQASPPEPETEETPVQEPNSGEAPGSPPDEPVPPPEENLANGDED